MTLSLFPGFSLHTLMTVHCECLFTSLFSLLDLNSLRQVPWPVYYNAHEVPDAWLAFSKSHTVVLLMVVKLISSLHLIFLPRLKCLLWLGNVWPLCIVYIAWLKIVDAPYSGSVHSNDSTSDIVLLLVVHVTHPSILLCLLSKAEVVLFICLSVSQHILVTWQKKHWAGIGRSLGTLPLQAYILLWRGFLPLVW